MIVGFTSKTFTGTETDGFATVSVQVLTSSSGGALKSFDITLLPEKGIFTLLYVMVKTRKVVLCA